MTSCPVCNKPVDPIRARFVAVRAGKVVAYCSPECREVQDTKPTKMPVPASVKDLDSGPVIEILHEPASGVVTSAKDERTTQPTGKFEKDEVVEVKETKPRTDGSKSSGGADKAAAAGELPDKGSKDLPKRQRTRPSGKHLTRERKDSTEARAGWDWLDDEPAEHARPGTVTESERRARWPFVLLLVLAAAGVGGYYVWKHVLNKERPAKASTVAPTNSDFIAPADAAEVEAVPDGEPLTADSAVRDAKSVLLDYIKDGSPRVSRLAAGALGRTGDPAAVAALQQAVKQEKVAAARFKVAYELARAGDKSGREALVTGLGAPERSDKLDAATRLAQLGDDRAKPLLSSLLNVAQHKLRAAEELARLRDPAASKLLEQVRADAKSSVDEKATATIALYRAGKRELADDVKKLLEVDSWKAFAAYALGEAGDASAKPLLVEQLTKGVGVKVRAAYALRPLVGDDAVALLAPLVEQLRGPKDQEQIMAAEAILLLAGDPAWATHP